MLACIQCPTMHTSVITLCVDDLMPPVCSVTCTNLETFEILDSFVVCLELKYFQTVIIVVYIIAWDN